MGTGASGEQHTVRLPESVQPQQHDAAHVRELAVGELGAGRSPRTVPDATPGVDGRGTVLVVVNDDSNRFISGVLAGTYRVIGVQSAREALQVMSQVRPDLVIVDVTIRGTSGEELLRTLRARPEYNRMPVVMLTPVSDAETRVRLLRAGAQDYVTTPVLIEELKARVANLIAIKRASDLLLDGLDSGEQGLVELAQAQISRQREIAHARDEAERASRARDEFLSVVSHELRTPLNVIQGWMWQLKRQGASPEARTRALDIIERNIAVQARLVDDLLDTSRAAIGKLHLRKRVVDLCQVCRSAVDNMERHAQLKGLSVTCTAPDAPVLVWGDADRVQQAISNLLSNALKFTPAGGGIVVTASRGDTRARVTVSDTGTGVPPEFLPSMFEPFAQADKSMTRQFGGLGLGLAIVKQIMTLHGGTVSAISEGDDHGTTITLEFPIPAVLEEPDDRLPPPDVATAAGRLDGVKVLVVDDESDARDAVRMVLEEYGAVVETAASAGEALDALHRMQPHVLVADLAMPEGDGYQLIREVRARSASSRLPAVALTAYTDMARDPALTAGFQRFTSKPIRPEDLVTLVEGLTASATR
jgi:signal transduction histidine kinase